MNDTLPLLAPNSGFSLSLLLISISYSRLERTDGQTDGTNQRETETTFACKCSRVLFLYCIFLLQHFTLGSAKWERERERERVVLLHIIALRRLPRCAHADTLTAHTPSKLARALHSILTASLCVSFLLFLLSYFIQWPSFVRAGPFSTFDAQPQCQKVFFKRLNYLVAVTLCVPASA